VPIAYGENPVDFIAYGPFGEVREFNRTYRVSTQVIRQRRFECALSAGACRELAPCEATANADLRYGFSRRITAFAGLEQFWRDTLPNLFHPYAGVIAGLTNAFVVEAEAVGNAILRGQLRFEPSSDLVLVAEASRFADDVVEPILRSESTRQFVLRPGPASQRRAQELDRPGASSTSSSRSTNGSGRPTRRVHSAGRCGPSRPYAGKNHPKAGQESPDIISPTRHPAHCDLGSSSASCRRERVSSCITRGQARSIPEPSSAATCASKPGLWFTGSRRPERLSRADLPTVRAIRQ
jgi:hypothetical protein